MWKASIGVKPIPPPKPAADEDDDWETDPNFVNNISEKESRWGAKTVEGSGHQDSVCMDELRDAVLQSDAKVKESLFSQPKPSAGYGGKFGVETDRVDKSAAGYDYKGKVESHASQRDYSKGFGGVFGVQTDRQDQSAVGWADREALAKHESQKDYAVGFGGKHGVQSDRKDKSAVGWDHHEKLQQHESQKDYKQGFGGQYGVQADRKDKSAVGWDDNEKLQQHESQTDYKKGFGGQFGVQVDRKDKSAVGWNDHEKWQQHENQIVKKTVEERSTAGSAVSRHNLEKHESQKPAAAVSMECGQAMSILRNKFEQLVTAGSIACDEAKVREERERRRREDEQLRQQQADAERQRQQKIDAEWAAVPADQTLQDQALQADEPLKSWPSIGIRLPYSTAAITKDAAPPKPARTPEHAVQDQATAVPPTPPPTTEATVAAVLPPSLSALLPPRRSSTDDEANDNNDEEWADHSSGVSSQQPTVAQQQQTLPQTQQSQLQYEEPPPVETVNQAELQSHQQPQQPIGGLTAVALFDYERQDDDEIGFNVDDIITDIEQIDAGWWRGTCHGRFGLFPANYVQLR